MSVIYTRKPDKFGNLFATKLFPSLSLSSKRAYCCCPAEGGNMDRVIIAHEFFIQLS
jgi:hypothetical protein